jgi:putative peptide zinc metalloprotease protein
VAVAFQVVLLVGSVDVVVPENLSAAVNYGCVQCVTYALATQLVLTVPGELSEQGTRELAAVWAELQAFGERITDVPLSELRARLTEFEQRISAVVRREGQDAVPAQETVAPDEGATPSSTGGPSGGASPTRSSPAGGTAERTSEAAPTGSSGSSTSSAAFSTAPSTASTSAAPSSAGTTPATGSGTTAPEG